MEDGGVGWGQPGGAGKKLERAKWRGGSWGFYSLDGETKKEGDAGIYRGREISGEGEKSGGGRRKEVVTPASLCR